MISIKRRKRSLLHLSKTLQTVHYVVEHRNKMVISIQDPTSRQRRKKKHPPNPNTIHTHNTYSSCVVGMGLKAYKELDKNKQNSITYSSAINTLNSCGAGF